MRLADEPGRRARRAGAFPASRRALRADPARSTGSSWARRSALLGTSGVIGSRTRRCSASRASTSRRCRSPTRACSPTSSAELAAARSTPAGWSSRSPRPPRSPTCARTGVLQRRPGARLRGRTRRLRRRVRVLPLPQAPAVRLPEDRWRLHPLAAALAERPARRQGARGRGTRHGQADDRRVRRRTSDRRAAARIRRGLRPGLSDWPTQRGAAGFRPSRVGADPDERALRRDRPRGPALPVARPPQAADPPCTRSGLVCADRPQLRTDMRSRRRARCS